MLCANIFFLQDKCFRVSFFFKMITYDVLCASMVARLKFDSYVELFKLIL